MSKKNKTYLVRVKEINDDIILKLLDYGTVEIVTEIIPILAVTTFEENKDKIRNIKGVISVENNSFGSFNI